MANIGERLDRALFAAGIPIVGVVIGTITDRTTWVVQYRSTATAQQRADGEAIRLTFDPDAQAVIDAEVTANATATSRQKDILSTCALIVRHGDLAAWNAMTLAQKKAATLAEADIWRAMREFAEKNL